MTSSSTLARRARAEKDPRKAAMLRKRAAKLRREERSAAKMTGLGAAEIKRIVDKTQPGKSRMLADQMEHAIKTGKHSGIVVGLDPKLMQIGGNAERAASVDSMPLVRKPWYEEEAEIARLAALAKKPDAFKAQFLGMIASSRFDGRTKALVERDGEAAESNKRWAINFVSGFLARMNAEAKANGGPLPRAVVVDGVTMARVVDALEKAGYTPDGVTGLRRAVG